MAHCTCFSRLLALSYASHGLVADIDRLQRTILQKLESLPVGKLCNRRARAWYVVEGAVEVLPIRDEHAGSNDFVSQLVE